MKGLGFQQDGTHYTSMKLQPVQLAYMLYATPCFCKLAKYLTRDKGDKLTNLKKALHCIKLEQDLIEYADTYFNKLDGLVSIEEGKALIAEFTENNSYRKALLQLWMCNYDMAILVVEDIIRKYEENI
jgi:hypothetical protein